MATSARYSAQFPSTRWTLVVRAAHNFTPESRQALEELCRVYWPPLYAYLLRSGMGTHEAKDIVQSYLTRLLERGDLQTIDADRGRFRSYLLAGLRNFLVSENRRDSAQKRGGGHVIPLEADGVDAGSFVDTAGLSPDEAYDRQWAQTILLGALETLRRENVSRGRQDLFEVLKSSLSGADREDHEISGRTLGMTPGAVAVAVHRLRLRLRELVRVEVAQTVQDPAEVEEEMRNLKSILSHSP